MARIGPAHVVDAGGERLRASCASASATRPTTTTARTAWATASWASFASDVFASLRGCDALADGWERHQCYGGVFMENLSAIGHPTRPPTALRPREPLYPCTAVAPPLPGALLRQADDVRPLRDRQRLRARCSRCARASSGPSAAPATAAWAATSPSTPPSTCSTREPGRARAGACACSAPTATARRECVVGVVRVILRDLAGGAAQTAAFCRALGAAICGASASAPAPRRTASCRCDDAEPATLPSSAPRVSR